MHLPRSTTTHVMVVAAGLCLVATPAFAQEPDAEPEPATEPAPTSEPAPADTTDTEPDTAADGTVRASASTDGSARMSAKGSGKDRDKWIHRWAPVNNMWEFGIYGGVWFPSRWLELSDQSPVPDRRYRKVAPEIGARAAYFPIRFLGVEIEGGAMPTRTRDTDTGATAWTVRGHVIGQLGLWSITPFLLAGTGVIGVNSPAAPGGVGVDQDVAIHFGGGAKFFINRWVMLRLDIRDVVSNRVGVGEGLTSSPEILLGLSLTLRPKKERKPKVGPKDRDGDGVRDEDDFCPDVFGVEPRGCPEVCFDDRDGDGLRDPDDQCPDEPETRNGFEDKDGCPDEVPPELSQLAGIMTGITFDTDKDTIKKDSKPTIDNAVEVMKKYPQIRVRIVGHTDSQGGYRHNIDLSKRRADSVRSYMVEQGIAEDRLETRGAGPDEPIDTNDTSEGRAKNRRIEFQILDGDDVVQAK